jgi:hypothetical protein
MVVPITHDPPALTPRQHRCVPVSCRHSPELAQAVIDSGALNSLVSCLEEFDPGVKEAATWCLGYIAAHNTELAQQVVDAGGCRYCRCTRQVGSRPGLKTSGHPRSPEDHVCCDCCRNQCKHAKQPKRRCTQSLG